VGFQHRSLTCKNIKALSLTGDTGSG